MVARKEPTGWVQGIAISRSLFLRRKVARFFRTSAALFAKAVKGGHPKPCQRLKAVPHISETVQMRYLESLQKRDCSDGMRLGG